MTPTFAPRPADQRPDIDMLAERLRLLLGSVQLAPYRLRLDTGDSQPPVAQLRGVWGAALHALDRMAYDAVFAPDSQAGLPGYLLAQDPEDGSRLRWQLFGPGLDHQESLRRAWDVASGMGLGSARRPFVVRECLLLGPDGQPLKAGKAWSLDRLAWPLSGETAPCRLVFPTGLRLLRDKRLLSSPTLGDLVVAAFRRLHPLLPAACLGEAGQLQAEALEAARQRPIRPWVGEKHQLHRWSARQQAEIDLRGVQGELELPEGPGPLWPLLAAGSWLHLGKGTTHGLGQMVIQPTGNDAVKGP